jgi:two-component system, cell cycle response regulator
MASERILICDEDPDDRQTISWLLKEHGYQVTAVEDGSRLLAAMEERAPDLVLIAGAGNNGEGVHLLERMKADERWRELPVLMVSSRSPEESAVKTLGLVAADYLPKPYRVRELLARIQAQLRMRAVLRSAREALRTTEVQLQQAREDAENQRKVVDILHDVTGDLTSEEIYNILARRVARALSVSHCSVILARPGDAHGIVATAFEHPALHNHPIELARYPELRAALDAGSAVLVEDVRESQLYEGTRELWEREGLNVEIRSVIALPFTLDRRQAGVFFLRRMLSEPPLTAEDVHFADAVIKAAVAAIQRAQVIEMTKADNARLEALALTDPLTLVLNRRALVSRLMAEVDRARRYESVVTILMIDLDHFKGVNDTYGHPAGDQVLRDVAQLLQHEVRSVDIVARYGGEEFMIVLPETSTEGAVTFAERIRERIESQTFESTGHSLLLTTSIGVASFPSPRATSMEDLVARADEALYRAKAEGRNRVRSE